MIAGSSVVVLDACVLYPAGLRSLLMWLAVHEVIRPKWTEEIHEEWMRNVLKDRPDLTREQLERTRRLMDEHAGDCLVAGHLGRVPELSLPDPDDRHVLAAAIEAGADAIVTWNVGDFPESEIKRHGLEIRTPDQLIVRLLEIREADVLAAMREHRGSLLNPPKSPDEYAANLAGQGLVETVRLLQSRLDSI